MPYLTSKQVFDLVLPLMETPGCKDSAKVLRSSGKFSAAAEAVVERLQIDEVYRQRLISDQTFVIDYARKTGMSAHEVIGVTLAAFNLVPQVPPPLTPEFLAAVFKGQDLDFGNVRDSKIDTLMKKLIEDGEYRGNIVYQPCQTLGPENLNRVEFIILYLYAVNLLHIIGQLRQLPIAEEFLIAAGLSPSEALDMVNDVRRKISG